MEEEKMNYNDANYFQNQKPLYKILTRYKVYVQGLGYQDYKKNGKGAGTTGKFLRIESLKIEIPFKPCQGGIIYRVKINGQGWTAWTNEGEEVGIAGSGKKLENIEIKLFGELQQLYDVNYRTHSFLVGWEKWVKNGEKTGSSRIEMIQIFISPKFEFPEP